MMMTLLLLLLSLLLLLLSLRQHDGKFSSHAADAAAFVGSSIIPPCLRRTESRRVRSRRMALGDYTIELAKPLGIILEELDDTGGGGGGGEVKVKGLVEGGNAATAKAAMIVPGDDGVVRQAVREIRHNGRLGELLNVKVIVGAGVQQENDTRRGMVRFFAIFSTDGVTTYSCNVAATGVQQLNNGNNENNIKIVSLSCAKDEGLGRTYDLIVEK